MSPGRRWTSTPATTRWGCELQEVAQHVFELRDASRSQLALGEPLELTDHTGGDRLEASCAWRQKDARSACIVGIGTARHEALGFQLADERRHRLLAQSCPPRELAHPQAVLLVERHEDRAVRRTDVAVARLGEGGCEQLVPALRRLRQQEAEVIACDAYANSLRMFSNSRTSDWYWDSNNSSGMPRPWNIVKV
jgi:hypothetical protein